MDFFGSRLKEERERLNLSQAKLAEACHVGKTAQYNYEAGARFPDVQYLWHAAKLGISVEYVVTGQRALPWKAGLSRVLKHIERRSGIASLDLDAIIHLVTLDEQNRNNHHWNGRFIEDGQLALLIDALFDDQKLIDQIMFSVGGISAKSDLKLPPDQFVRVSLRLFQEFKRTGEFNQEKVSETISILTL